MTDGQMFKFDFGYLFSVYTQLLVSAKILGMLIIGHYNTTMHYFTTIIIISNMFLKAVWSQNVLT